MPVIDLGMSFNEAKEEGERQKLKLTTGPYKLACREAKLGESKEKKTPQVAWLFEVVENQNSDFNGKQLRSWTSLPHDGKSGGIGYIVEITEALGVPWDGQSFELDACVGKMCNANVGLDKNGYNVIESFI